jgi:hypothetical protein
VRGEADVPVMARKERARAIMADVEDIVVVVIKKGVEEEDEESCVKR